MKVSGCLITKNEERCIARCINSFKSIVDEIILVDTGSTDKTVEIAERLGAKTYYFDWIGDFAAARNYALDRCTGDWIIFLDADEYFIDGTERNLLKHIKANDKKTQTHGLVVQARHIKPTAENPEGKDTGAVGWHLRVFRNLKNLRFIGTVHEVLKIDGKKNPYIIMVPGEEVFMIHDGYTGERILSKDIRNVELLLEKVNSLPPGVIDLNYFYLGQSYCNMKDYTNAYNYMKQYIDSGNYESYFGLRSHFLMADIMANLGYSTDEVREMLNDGKAKHPDNPAIHFLLGEHEYDLKNYTETLMHYEKADELLGKKPEMRVDFDLTIGKKRYIQMFLRLGMIYEMKNNYKQAEKNYMRAIDVDKFYPKALEALITLHKNDKDDSLIALLSNLYNTGDIKHLTRIVNSLRVKHPRMVFLYYFEKYYEIVKRVDLNFCTMLAVIGEYNQSFQHYMKRLEETKQINYAVKALCLALMARSEDMLVLLSLSESKNVAEIAKVLNENEGDLSNIEYNGAYLMTLNELLTIAGLRTVATTRLLDAMKYFDSSVLPGIGMLLLDHGYYEECNELMQQGAEQDEDEELARDCMLYSIQSLFKLEDYNGANEMLQKALKRDPDSNIFKCFEIWIDEKINSKR